MALIVNTPHRPFETWSTQEAIKLMDDQHAELLDSKANLERLLADSTATQQCLSERVKQQKRALRSLRKNRASSEKAILDQQKVLDEARRDKHCHKLSHLRTQRRLVEVRGEIFVLEDRKRLEQMQEKRVLESKENFDGSVAGEGVRTRRNEGIVNRYRAKGG